MAAKKAGMILSEFTLLGIGGKSLSEENAVETAKVINAVNPEFIRANPLPYFLMRTARDDREKRELGIMENLLNGVGFACHRIAFK